MASKAFLNLFWDCCFCCKNNQWDFHHFVSQIQFHFLSHAIYILLSILTSWLMPHAGDTQLSSITGCISLVHFLSLFLLVSAFVADFCWLAGSVVSANQMLNVCTLLIRTGTRSKNEVLIMQYSHSSKIKANKVILKDSLH